MHRASVIAICLFAVMLVAQHAYAQNRDITLKLHDVTIKEALKKVENSTDYFFLYNNDLIDVDRKVDIDIEGATIEKIIEILFRHQKINFVIKGRQIVLSPLDLQEFENTNSARGQVLTEKGEPLPGVAVVIQGTTTGTTTDADGNFSIQLKSRQAVLEFSFIGMETQSVAYNGQNYLNIVMRSGNKQIDEVIIVAYGKQSTETLTGAITSIDMETIDRVSSPNISGAIQSAASGVLVVNASGAPGEKPQIRIRGDGSINYSNEPLWVLDDVIYGNSSPDVNPNDIESVSVLKDAAASALYGSRASNGVILIETKTGKLATSEFKFISNFGVTALNQGNFQLMNGQEFYDYISPLVKNKDVFPLPDPNSDSVTKGTNWIDLATRTGSIQDYNLSYRGGSKKTMIYTNVGYYNEDGAVVGHKWEKFSGRINFDYIASKRVKLIAKLSGIYQNWNNNENELLSYAYLMLPWDNPYNTDGSIKQITNDRQSPVWYSREKLNPLFNRQFNYNNRRSSEYMSDIKLEVQLTDWLRFTSVNRLRSQNTRYENIVDSRSSVGQADNGTVENDYSYFHDLFTSNVFHFDHSAGKNRVFGIAGYEYSKSYADNIIGIGKGVYPGLEILNTTSVPKYLDGTKTQSAFLSILTNIQYIYDDKYMCKASFRRDGSSRFGANNRFGNFYSLGLSWMVHRENFMKSLDFVDQLKVRASYGSVGNANISDFVAYGLYNMTVQYNGVPGGFPRRLDNPDLTWESNYNTNLAIDVSLFQRFNFSVDLYNIKTKNLLQNVPLPMVSGYYWLTDNVGSIQNRGVEFNLDAHVLKYKDFGWKASFNISRNKNRVLELNENKEIITGNKIIRVGWDMNTWYLRKWVGVNPENGDPLWEKVVVDDHGNSTAEVTNNYSQATLQNMGSSAPDFYGGFTNQFRYKMIGVTASFNFVSGNKIYNSYRELFDNDGAYPSYNSMKLNEGWTRWEKPGDEATHPKPVLQGNKLSNKVSSRFLEDGSYLRLRQLAVTCNLPKSFVNRLGMKDVLLKVSGENLFTLSHFSGMDPEVGIDGNAGALFPVTKKYVFGIEIGF